MTQEEKQLLLKDLCARLPYGVKIRACQGGEMCVATLDSIAVRKNKYHWFTKYYYSDAPGVPTAYLRPLSSMTEEEKEEYNKVMFQSEKYKDDYAADIDWLNVHHFDYRGLIEKGLALEAQEEMYENG